MLPPSTDGIPIDAVKMHRTLKNRKSGSKKKRDKGDGNKTIRRKKSKSDNEESHKGVVDLEQMEKMMLKVKGTKSSARKGKARKDKEENTPNSGKSNICGDGGQKRGEGQGNRVKDMHGRLCSSC